MNSTIKAAENVAEELNQSKLNNDALKEDIQYITAKSGESFNKKWESKLKHCQYNRSLDRQLISKEDTFLRLSRGELKVETESEIIAAQVQALQTKYHATKILQTETDSKCRLCKQFDETLEHIISAYTIMAKKQYIDTIECVIHCTLI